MNTFRVTLIVMIALPSFRGFYRNQAIISRNVFNGITESGSLEVSKWEIPPPKFRSEPFGYLEEIDLEISAVTNRGMGIGRKDGWVVMVGDTIPGEKVRAAVFKNHANFSEAAVTQVLTASEDRVTPKCKYYGHCGGCQYQHISIERQREIKREHVVESLGRIGGIEVPVLMPLGTSHTYHYRSKLTPHYNRPNHEGEVGSIGFDRRPHPTMIFQDRKLREIPFKKIVNIDECCIATESINASYLEAVEKTREKIRERVRAADGDKQRLRKIAAGTILLRDTNEGVIMDHDRNVTQTVGGVTYSFLASDFFQTNPFAIEVLVDYVKNVVKSGDEEYLVDAYCGVGLFSIPLSKSFKSCIGIEISKRAVSNAQRNAEENDAGNCEFKMGTASAIFKDISYPPEKTVMIIDPPRKGCDSEFLSQLLRYRPSKLIYVSCDPATQARDAAVLVTGGYRVVTCQPVDLFPQTRHIENVLTLKL